MRAPIPKGVDPLRLLALFILVPAWWQLRKRADVEPFGRLLTDKIMFAMFVLEIVLTLPERTPLANLHLTILDKLGISQPSFGNSTGVIAEV